MIKELAVTPEIHPENPIAVWQKIEFLHSKGFITDEELLISKNNFNLIKNANQGLISNEEPARVGEFKIHIDYEAIPETIPQIGPKSIEVPPAKEVRDDYLRSIHKKVEPDHGGIGEAILDEDFGIALFEEVEDEFVKQEVGDNPTLFDSEEVPLSIQDSDTPLRSRFELPTHEPHSQQSFRAENIMTPSGQIVILPIQQAQIYRLALLGVAIAEIEKKVPSLKGRVEIITTSINEDLSRAGWKIKIDENEKGNRALSIIKKEPQSKKRVAEKPLNAENEDLLELTSTDIDVIISSDLQSYEPIIINDVLLVHNLLKKGALKIDRAIGINELAKVYPEIVLLDDSHQRNFVLKRIEKINKTLGEKIKIKLMGFDSTDDVMDLNTSHYHVINPEDLSYAYIDIAKDARQAELATTLAKLEKIARRRKIGFILETEALTNEKAFIHIKRADGKRTKNITLNTIDASILKSIFLNRDVSARKVLAKYSRHYGSSHNVQIDNMRDVSEAIQRINNQIRSWGLGISVSGDLINICMQDEHTQSPQLEIINPIEQDKLLDDQTPRLRRRSPSHGGIKLN